MWGVTTPSMTSPLASLQPSADVQAFDVRLVADCLSGPGAEVENACSAADLDSDGDVDLHDLSAYQRQSAGLQ
jgi:hypothetical protein